MTIGRQYPGSQPADAPIRSRQNHSVEEALPHHDAREAQAEVLHHHAAEIAGGGDAPRVAQEVVHESVQIARMRGGVVEPVGRQVGIADAQIGNDHLEAGGGERLDVALPDALRLRPAVQDPGALELHG